MKKLLTLTATTLLLAANASATLLVRDHVLVQSGPGTGYNLDNLPSGAASYLAGSLDGQNATAGVFGYTSGFATGTSAFQSSAFGLDYPLNIFLQSQGGSFKLYHTDTSYTGRRTITRTINAITGPSVNNTLYMSALVRAEAGYMLSSSTQNGTGVGIGLLNRPSPPISEDGYATPNGGGVMIGFHRNGASRNLVAWITGTPVLLVQDAQDDTTYFVVIRMDFNMGGTDTFSIAVDPEEPEVYGVVTNKAVLTSAEPSFVRAGLSGNHQAHSKTVWFDELRVGTTWNDVAPFDEFGEVALGAIKHNITPSAVSVDVAVTTPGVDGTLAFAYGDAPGNLTTTNTYSSVGAITYNFPVTGIGRGATVHYHVTLSTLLPTPAAETRTGSFPIISDCVWTGAVDSDWHTAGNWDPGVPFSSDSVFFNALPGNAPILVTATNNMAVANLTVRSGASAATFDLGGNTLTAAKCDIGANGVNANFTLANGNIVVAGATIVGNNTAGSAGTPTVTLASGARFTTQTLSVGYQTTGGASSPNHTVNVNAGATLEVKGATIVSDRTAVGAESGTSNNRINVHGLYLANGIQLGANNGWNDGTALLTVDNGTVTNTASTRLGVYAGAGHTLTLQNNARFVQTSGTLFINHRATVCRVLVLDGSEFNLTGNVEIGYGADNTSPNNRLIVSNAVFTATGALNAGSPHTAHSQGVLVYEDPGHTTTVTFNGSANIGNNSATCLLSLNGGSFKSGALTTANVNGGFFNTAGNQVRIAGRTAKIRASSASIRNDAILSFTLPPDGFAETPLVTTGNVTVNYGTLYWQDWSPGGMIDRQKDDFASRIEIHLGKFTGPATLISAAGSGSNLLTAYANNNIKVFQAPGYAHKLIVENNLLKINAWSTRTLFLLK